MYVVPVLIALVMPNWYLEDNQNAVENVSVAGEVVGFALGSDEDEDEDYRYRTRCAMWGGSREC
jgi:hypothetical protein